MPMLPGKSPDRDRLDNTATNGAPAKEASAQFRIPPIVFVGALIGGSIHGFCGFAVSQDYVGGVIVFHFHSAFIAACPKIVEWARTRDVAVLR